MKADKFTFHRSFYEAIKDLPKSVQTEVLQAVMEYGLNGTLTENLKPVSKAIVVLIKSLMDMETVVNEVKEPKKAGNPNFKKGKANPYKTKQKDNSTIIKDNNTDNNTDNSDDNTTNNSDNNTNNNTPDNTDNSEKKTEINLEGYFLTYHYTDGTCIYRNKEGDTIEVYDEKYDQYKESNNVNNYADNNVNNTNNYGNNYIYSNNNNNNNNNTGGTTPPENNKYKQLLLNDGQYLEVTAMQKNTNVETIKHYLTKFENHLIQLGVKKQNERDFKQHFTFWLNKQKIKTITPPRPPMRYV